MLESKTKNTNGKPLILVACVWLLISLPTLMYISGSLTDFEDLTFYTILYGVLALGGIVFALGYYQLYPKLSALLRISLGVLMFALYSAAGYFLFFLLSVLFTLLNLR